MCKFNYKKNNCNKICGLKKLYIHLHSTNQKRYELIQRKGISSKTNGQTWAT